MLRRICLYGGPGVGKSTIALKLVGMLKHNHFDVELIQEYIKTWAYSNKKPLSFDQFYVFAKQLYAEDTALRNVKLIVSDSPLYLNIAYSRFYNFSLYSAMIAIAAKFEEMFPAINVFIDRTVDYVSHGRYQNYKEALQFDQQLKDFLFENRINCVHVTVDDYEKLFDQIEGRLLNDSTNS